MRPSTATQTISGDEPRPRTGPPRVVRADDLLDESGQLRIDLDGEIYTLRLTRNNRLILTK